MAIEFVGSITAGAPTTGTTYNVSLTALTGGIGTSAQSGDLVLVVTGLTLTAASTVGVTTGGYTNSHASIYVNDVFDTNFIVQYKRMSGTPDTSVTVNAPNNGNHSGATVVMVFRGVDPTTPMDVTPTTANGINTAVADPPSITPTTAGSWIVNCVFSAVDDISLYAEAPPAATYTYVSTVEKQGSISGCLCGASVKTDWTSGAFDQGAWTGVSVDVNESWAASTIALRPDPSYTGGGSSTARPVVFVCT